ncbi:GAF domain-containing protein [Kocuria aegyptia]|uniref:ANTAR domain-containing protein n=1 Tax=Kocuria aegyptia TaxID=330943 RepID=A0ABN2KNC2_9MICC
MFPEPSPGGQPATPTHLTGLLLSVQDVAAAMHHLACAAQQGVPDASGTGISLLDEDGTGSVVASTGTAAGAAGALQHGLGTSPCLSARTTGEVQRIDDTGTDSRWPKWQSAAAGVGIRSALSTPLVRRGHRLGALTVHASTPGAFGAAEERLLGLLADAAATLLGAAHAVDAPVRLSIPWEETLDPRELMGLAAGVLMARDQLTPEAARAALAEEAGTQDRGVAEVAAATVDAAVGHEQARRLQATMTTAFISRHDLWLRHFSLGGNVKEFEIDAYLHQAMLLPQFQRDLLAHAANDILEEIAPPRASYTSEALAGLASSLSIGGKDDEASPAADAEGPDRRDPDAPSPFPRRP